MDYESLVQAHKGGTLTCPLLSGLAAPAGSWIKGAAKAAGIPVYSIKAASLGNLVR